MVPVSSRVSWTIFELRPMPVLPKRIINCSIFSARNGCACMLYLNLSPSGVPKNSRLQVGHAAYHSYLVANTKRSFFVFSKNLSENIKKQGYSDNLT